MKKIIHTVKTNKEFSISFILFLLMASLFLLLYKENRSFLILNRYHNPGLDTFFLVYDHIGNGVFSIIVGLVLLFIKRVSLSIQVFAAYFISGIVAQIIKKLVYSPRPRLIFDALAYPDFIAGVSLANGSGFPSGHTASAFALATLLALHTKNKKASILFLLAAIVAGYCRIYLGQHFLKDVIAGALLGAVTSFFVYTFMQHLHFKIRFPERTPRVKEDHKQTN